MLAKRENMIDLFNIIWEKMTHNEKRNIMMITDISGNIPLHCAARSNQLEICKELLGVIDRMTTSSNSPPVISMIDLKNTFGQTAALIASEMGHKDIVTYFWEVTNKDPKAGLYKRDDDRKSCLHLAAAKGKYIT